MSAHAGSLRDRSPRSPKAPGGSQPRPCPPRSSPGYTDAMSQTRERGSAKTRPNEQDPAAVIAAHPHEGRRADGERVLDRLTEITGQPPVLWGGSIIGFGEQNYDTAAGIRSTTPSIAFALRSTGLVFYGLLPEAPDAAWQARLDELGPVRATKGCVYVTRLARVDEDALFALAADAYARETARSGAASPDA